MTKSLQEIQEENRKLIFERTFGRGYESLPITLNIVLLALSGIATFTEKSLHGKWLDIRSKVGENFISWDLMEETIEQQEESTQREINKLLTA